MMRQFMPSGMKIAHGAARKGSFANAEPLHSTVFELAEYRVLKFMPAAPLSREKIATEAGKILGETVADLGRIIKSRKDVRGAKTLEEIDSLIAKLEFCMDAVIFYSRAKAVELPSSLDTLVLERLNMMKYFVHSIGNENMVVGNTMKHEGQFGWLVHGNLNVSGAMNWEDKLKDGYVAAAVSTIMTRMRLEKWFRHMDYAVPSNKISSVMCVLLKDAYGISVEKKGRFVVFHFPDESEQEFHRQKTG
jgi:hypothetical protein